MRGEVMEDEEDITEDCLEKTPSLVFAANSKADIADLLDTIAFVSTYMTAST